MPRVSVVMPAYNAARYVGAAVRSVLQQGFRDFELLVVDQSVESTPSREIVQRLASVDSRVRLVCDEGKGAARARNEIITYTPHFWLGIAKFNLGDLDGALREWKTSEEQGVVQNTPYYAQLREWVARSNTEKQRLSENAAADSKAYYVAKTTPETYRKAATEALTQATGIFAKLFKEFPPS